MTDPISEAQAQELLKKIVQWHIDESGKTLAKTFTFDDFQNAVVFVNLVAKAAEEKNHHPDIFIHNYNNVTVSLTTHSVDGLSQSDFELAAVIDAL